MQADLNTVGLAFLIIGAALTFVVPRQWAFVPLMASACYVTVGQIVMIGELDFTIHRLLMLIAWARVILRKELTIDRLNATDRALVVWALTAIVTHTVLVGTTGAFVNRLSFAYNALGFYFLFRNWIVDLEDVRRMARWLAFLIAPVAVMMVTEHLTRNNLFAAFGGVPALAAIRDGDIRAQGPFRHPILAGVFAATSVPLLLGLWWHRDGSNRFWAVVGIISAAAIAWSTSSSGPIVAFLASVLGMAAWRIHDKLRPVWIAALFGVVAIDLYMKSSVWYLIGRVGNVLGGQGHHRSLLIDRAIEHLDEWWLIGTTYTAHWMPHALPTNPNMADITNYYIRMGVDGGLVTMALFMLFIIMGFRTIGRGIRRIDELDVPLPERMTVWSLGAVLFAHAIAFSSVSYFDQIVVFWYMALGLLSSAGDIAVQAQQEEPAPHESRASVLVDAA